VASATVGARGGFSLLEVMVVVILIGILSALAYSSLMELVFTNRAKETAQTMRTFVERALVEGKRQGKEVEIKIDGNNIQYTIDGNATPISESLSQGYSGGSASVPTGCTYVATGLKAEPRIGLSGVTTGCFVACGARDYCAAAMKTIDKNSFTAHIKRGTNATNWEAL